MDKIYNCSPNCTYKTDKTSSVTGHKRVCKLYKRWEADFLLNNREKIIDLYVNQQKSLPDLKNIFQFDTFSVFMKFLKKENLQRTIKEASLTKTKKDKAKKTNLEKHGAEHNFCKTHPSRQKWEKELFEREGITNVFQRETVKEKCAITNIKKYGCKNPAIVFRKGRENFTSIHKWTFELLKFYLDKSQICTEKKLLLDKKTYFSYDIWIRDTKILIEVNGDYWHANPIFYDKTDFVKYSKTVSKTAEEIWNRDRNKIKHAKKCGFKIYTIWEDDIKKKPEQTAKKLLKWIAGKNENCKDQIDKQTSSWDKIRYHRRWKP